MARAHPAASRILRTDVPAVPSTSRPLPVLEKLHGRGREAAPDPRFPTDFAEFVKASETLSELNAQRLLEGWMRDAGVATD